MMKVMVVYLSWERWLPSTNSADKVIVYILNRCLGIDLWHAIFE